MLEAYQSITTHPHPPNQHTQGFQDFFFCAFYRNWEIIQHLRKDWGMRYSNQRTNPRMEFRRNRMEVAKSNFKETIMNILRDKITGCYFKKEN